MSSGYFEKKVDKLLGDLGSVDYEEDWDAQTVTVSTDPKERMEITVKLLNDLMGALGTTDLTLQIEGDGRYADQGCNDATITFVFKKVKFPQRPE